MSTPRFDRVTYHVESQRPELEYALRQLLISVGVAPAPAARDEAQVLHGPQPAAATRLHIPEEHEAATGGWLSRLDDQPAIPALSFDIVAAAFALLADEVNARAALGRDAFDAHDRLRRDASWQAQHAVALTPTFNRLVGHLRIALQKAGIAGEFLPLWPPGKRFAVGLSHDVDSPDKYALLSLARYRPQRLLATRKTPLRFVNAIRRRLRDRSPNDYWLFDAILEEEGRRGFKSSFYFASVPAQDPLGAVHDVDYDIEWPHFRTAIRAILDAGWEVGLHTGYNACSNDGQVALEKSRIEEVMGLPARGLRHHYWHLGPQPERTLAAHAAAGFAYDSSLGFNDAPGFRRNTALPFRPWDPVRGEAIATLQLPTMCMDGNFFYHSNDAEAAVAAITELLETLRATEGFGSIDWHARASAPRNRDYFAWGSAYLAVLDWLAAAPDAWVPTMTEAEAWWTARERQLTERAAPA